MKSIFENHIVKKLVVLFAFAIVAFIYFEKANETGFIQDDAFTSLRYAKNLIEGKGLVFNEGEYVEGYTNFSWVVLMSFIGSIAHTLNHDLDLNLFLEETSQILSIVFGFLVLVITYLLSRSIFLKTLSEKTHTKWLAEVSSFIPVPIVLYTTPFIYWSVSGMETSLFVFLTVLSVYLFINREKGKKYLYAFVIVSVINSLTRPEGTIFFGLMILFYLQPRLVNNDGLRWNIRIKNLFNKEFYTLITLYLIPISLYLTFRLLYYGYPLPNTFYAKTEFSSEFLTRGFNYVIEFAEAYLIYGLVLIPVLLQLFMKRMSDSEKLLLWIITAYTILIFLIGGDVLPIHRFFLTITPMIFILVLKSIFALIEEFSPQRFFTLPVLVASILLLAAGFYNYEMQKDTMMEKRAYETGLVEKMKIYAEFVKNIDYEQGKNKIKNKIKSKSKKVVAMSTIGAFSFYSDAHVIDIVGLTDEYIAHNPLEEEGIDEELSVLWKERRYNALYVVNRKPDYIIFPAGAKPSAFAECALFIQEEFYKNYYMQIFYSDKLNQLLPIFTRLENVRSDSLKNCSVAFLSRYINANNIFLKMIENKNRNLLMPILKELDLMLSACRNRETEVNTLKGMCFFHLQNFTIAKFYLQQAARKDSSNTIARYYLLNILNREGNQQDAFNLIPEILKFSPLALPNPAGNNLESH